MKIIHVIVGLGDGGAERSLFKLISWDTKNEHSVISLTTLGKYGVLLRENKVEVIALRGDTGLAILLLPRLVATLIKNRPDILHAWMPHAAFLATLAARLLKIRRLYWSIRASNYGRGLRSLPTRIIVAALARISSTAPRKIFVVGKRALELHVGLGFEVSKMICVQNGYSTSEIPALHRPLQHNELGNSSLPKQAVFGMAARFHPKKNHTGLLKAFAMVKESRDDWRLVLVGENTSTGNRALVAEIRKLGLENHVDLWGPVQDVQGFFTLLDFHVLSSSYGEGFPNVVAEAMLEGVPNIVTDVGDSAEIVGNSGWVVPPNSPTALADAILEALACSAESLEQRSILARGNIVSNYPIQRMIAGHQEGYSVREIFAFPRYSPLGASSRVRMFQYAPHFIENSWQISFFPFSNDSYLLSKYSGKGALLNSAISYIRRIKDLRNSWKADVVWLQKEMLPWWPAFAEKIITRKHNVTVYDFDDALHEQFRASRHFAFRAILGSKISVSTSTADLVLAGNPNLEHFFQKTARRTALIPSVVDVDRIFPKNRGRKGSGSAFTVGWIGTPVTFAVYMEPYLEMFERCLPSADSKLLLIGAGDKAASTSAVEFIDWRDDAENFLLNQLDVGIMPLEDDPWSRGKCGYKLLQYMAAGLPVIASPVGVNREIVEHGVDGFLVEEEGDWERYLSFLYNNRDIAREMGQRARSKIEASYSLQVVAPKLLQIFNDLGDEQGTN